VAAFRDEITSLDESFRNSVGYFDVSDLGRALDNLQQLKDILLNLLGLLRTEKHDVFFQRTLLSEKSDREERWFLFVEPVKELTC
jgi:hypothetical protein